MTLSDEEEHFVRVMMHYVRLYRADIEHILTVLTEGGRP